MSTFVTQEDRRDTIETFIAVLGRAPSQAELSEFTPVVANGDQLGLARTLFKSDDGQDLFGALTVREGIDVYFDNVLNRDATQEEADALTGLVQQRGALPTLVAVTNFVQNADPDSPANIDPRDAEQIAADKALVENKVLVAEYFAINGSGSAEDAQTILDGVTAETDTSSEAALQAYIDAQGGTAGETFTLTTSVDTVEGTSGDDTITGTLEDTGGASTITAGDSIDGRGGDGDRFNVIASSDNNEGNFASIDVTSVERFFFRNASDNTLDLDMSGVSGVEELWYNRGNDHVTLNNVGSAATIGLNGVGFGSSEDADDFDIEFADGVYSGSDDTLNVVLERAGDSVGGHSVELDVNNTSTDEVIENLNITSASAASDTGNYLDWDEGANTTSYVVTGSAALRLDRDAGDSAVAETVDASGLNADFTADDPFDNANGVTYTGATGADTVEFGSGDDTVDTGDGADTVTIGAGEDTVNTGAGNDRVNLSGDLTTADEIDGGAGDRDVVGDDSGELAALVGTDALDSLSNFEGVAVTNELAHDLDVSGFGAAANRVILDDGADINGRTLSGLNSGAVIESTSTSAVGGTASGEQVALTVPGATDAGSTDDSLNLETNADFTAGLTVQHYSVNGINTLNVTVADTDASTGSSADGVNLDLTESNNVGTINIDGDRAVSLDSNDGNTNSGFANLGTVDASASSGDVTLSLAGGFGGSQGVTFIGGSGNDMVTGTSFADDLTGGEGEDTFNQSAGNDILNLGSDSDEDTVVFGAAGSNGVDTINGFSAGGDAGNDQLDVSGLGTLAGTGIDLTAASDNLVSTEGVAAIGVTDQATSDFSDVASIIDSAVNFDATTDDGTTPDVSTVFVDNGTDTNIYLLGEDGSGGGASNNTVDAEEITLVGTLTGTQVADLAAGDITV